MDITAWELLRGEVLEPGYELRDLVRMEGGGAVFRGVATKHDLAPYQVFVLVEPAVGPEGDALLNRYREAAFLKHSNLIRVFSAERQDISGKPYICVIRETADASLDDALRQGPVNAGQARHIANDVAAALSYLHSENLVCCALRPEAVWRIGKRWAVGDFGNLRVAGKYKPQDTRALLLTRDFNAPPEAYAGLVSPAWDVWCLGAMLRRLLLPASPLPSPFDTIVRDSLAPNPGERISVDEVARLLRQPAEEPVAAVEAVEVTPPPAQPEPPPDRQPQQARPVLTGPPEFEGARPFLLVAVAACVLALLVLAFHHRSASVNPYAPEKQRQDANPSPISTQPRGAIENPKPLPAPVQPQSEREIQSLLDKWAASIRSRDVAKQVSCYAPVVDKYFGRQALTSNEIRREKERVFSLTGPVRRFEIANIHFDRVSNDQAVVSFDKQWSFGGRKPFTGAARDELVLRPVQGQWKIASERDIKVYWVNKGQQS